MLHIVIASTMRDFCLYPNLAKAFLLSHSEEWRLRTIQTLDNATVCRSGNHQSSYTFRWDLLADKRAWQPHRSRSLHSKESGCLNDLANHMKRNLMGYRLTTRPTFCFPEEERAGSVCDHQVFTDFRRDKCEMSFPRYQKSRIGDIRSSHPGR
jgi:hypothetical protein